jgi:phage gpG-like protein
MQENYSQQIDALFQRLKNKTTPSLSLMEKIAGHLKDNLRENLESEGKGAPNPWAALNPKYAKQKARMGMVQKILTATSAMEQSLYQRATATEAYAGINKVQAPLLNFGGTITRISQNRSNKSKFTKKGKVIANKKSFSGRQYSAVYPPRPFIYLTDVCRERIVKEIKDFVTKGTWEGRQN